MAHARDDGLSVSDLPDTDAAKVDPEELTLRAKPRPVTRINRRVLVLLSAVGLLLIFGATIFALDPPRLLDRDDTGRELYRADTNPTPEGLKGLPRSYSDLPSSPVQLGPPLPGDIGGAVVEKERELGIDPMPELPFRPSPEDDAARAERIRQARLAQQGREAGVFFQLASQTATGKQLGDSAATLPSAGDRNPFDAFGVAESNGGSGLDLGNDQNLQGRKLDFVNQGIEAGSCSPCGL